MEMITSDSLSQFFEFPVNVQWENGRPLLYKAFQPNK